MAGSDSASRLLETLRASTSVVVRHYLPSKRDADAGLPKLLRCGFAQPALAHREYAATIGLAAGQSGPMA
jgi:hypothetical protein